MKIMPQILDNRYTDVVSLQCKVHESVYTNYLIINHLKTTKHYGKKCNLLRITACQPQ